MLLEAKAIPTGFGLAFQGGYKPTIGADPEVFVSGGDGHLLPAFTFLPSKDKPALGIRYPEHVQGYWDGFQAEFRYHAAYTCLNVLAWACREGLALIDAEAKKKDANAKLTLKNVFRIKKTQLETLQDRFVELGCEPSFNIYGLKPATVENPRLLKYRFAGGHMHFGFEKHKHLTPEPIIKLLDKIVGVWSVGAAQSFDSPIRRQYYGLPGEYRTPKHGIEYRTLSNFWLCHPIIHQLTWELGRKAFELASRGPELASFWVAPDELVQECIFNGDVKLAKQILKVNKPMLEWMFGLREWNAGAVDRILSISANGIESVIKNPEDLYGNWKIDQIGLLDQFNTRVVFSELPTSSSDHPYWTFGGFVASGQEKI